MGGCNGTALFTWEGLTLNRDSDHYFQRTMILSGPYPKKKRKRKHERPNKSEET